MDWKELLGGPPDEVNLPSQRIRPAAGEVTWLVDEAAAQKLPETLKMRIIP